MQKSTSIFSKKFIWIALAILLTLTSCGLPGSKPEPTAIIYPTAVVAPTSPPLPTVPPPPTTPPVPNVSIANTSKEVVIGNPVVINYAVESFTGLFAVELSLNSVGGEVIAFDRTDDIKTMIGKIEYEAPWTADKAGEYTLYLIAYDLENRASEPATFIVTVLPLVSAEVVSVSQNAVVGKPVTIEFSVGSNTDTGFSSVELNLNSVNGQNIFFDRASNLKTETGEIGYGVEWTPTQAGEYTLYLTAYNLDGSASGTDTVTITVSPAP